MKKYFLKITTVFLLVGLLSSCEEKEVIYDGEEVVALFSTNFSQLNVLEVGGGTANIPVTVSNVSSTAREIVLSVDDAATTATDDQYTIDQATLVIPANSYDGVIKVSSNFESLPENTSVTLSLDLIEVGDSSINIDKAKSSFTLVIKRSCPFDIASVGTSFIGTSSVDDELISTFIPVVTKSGSDPRVFTFNTLWGTNFVGDITGNPGYNGQYLYAGTIRINDDLTLTITGSGSSTPGGVGTYDPCNETFSYTLTQGLFQDPFEVDVVLYPN